MRYLVLLLALSGCQCLDTTATSCDRRSVEGIDCVVCTNRAGGSNGVSCGWGRP